MMVDVICLLFLFVLGGIPALALVLWASKKGEDR